MATQTQMTPNGTIKSTGLLAVKGVLYILFGLALVLIAPDNRPSMFWLFGLLPVLSGACSIAFGIANEWAKRNNWLFVASGVIDMVFGGVIFVYVGSSGMGDRFWNVLVFWSVQYGFSQATQAMYTFGSTPSVSVLRGPVARLHFLSALIAIGLFGTLQLQPVDHGSALGWSAFLFMTLGVLLLFITSRLRAADQKYFTFQK
jgi:uncharacterized membrane protein HdeD (DUF308 family)